MKWKESRNEYGAVPEDLEIQDLSHSATDTVYDLGQGTSYYHLVPPFPILYLQLFTLGTATATEVLSE